MSLSDDDKREHSNLGNFLWYLRPSQWEIVSLCVSSSEPFLECSRRFGKTTSILVYCMTYLHQNPNTVARWCAPWKNQTREIVMPEFDKIQALADPECKAKFVSTDSYYRFPNGSRMYLRGMNDDRGESARGPFAHIVIIDELGSWRHPDCIESILRPQLLTTQGKLIIASTPSEDLGHSYYSRLAEARLEKRLIRKTIYDNESLTQKEIEKECENQGGPTSDSWAREYLCEPRAQSERLVVPEFKEAKHTVSTIKRPDYFDAYVSLDLGFNDFTALLFGHYNFIERTVYIERELLMRASNSEEISSEAKQIEDDLWGHKPYLRVCDNDLQQIYDLSTLHDYNVVPTRKDNKPAAINKLRTMFAENRIKIHDSCTNLIFQLKIGLWNESKKDFKRGDKTGHLDAIDALIYLVRNVNEYKNPTPATAGFRHETHFIDSSLLESQGSDLDSLRNALKR